MVHGLTPNFLSDLIPDRVGNVSNYNLRNADNIEFVNTNTNSYYYSFLPSVIRAWNDLSTELKNATSLFSFKRLLNNDVIKVPDFYLHGERKWQIYHARLRTNCSSLSFTLYSKNMVTSPLCSCGSIETPEHFFLYCQHYNHDRQLLMDKLSFLDQIDINTLLYGNNNLGYESNTKIVDAVHSYIKSSKRFVS